MFEHEFALSTYHVPANANVDELRALFEQVLNAAHFRLAIDGQAATLVVDHAHYSGDEPRSYCARRVNALLMANPAFAQRFPQTTVVPAHGPTEYHDLFQTPARLPQEGETVNVYLQHPVDHGRGFAYATFREGRFEFRDMDSSAWTKERFDESVPVGWHPIINADARYPRPR